MENLREASKAIKSGFYAQGETAYYKKAVPNFRFKMINFRESEFRIRLDMADYPSPSGNILRIGDICRIDPNFYYKLIGSGQRMEETIKETSDFALIAFADMSGKNYYAIFCVLIEISDLYGKNDLRFYNIPKASNGSMLLFWPQSLKIVNVE